MNQINPWGTYGIIAPGGNRVTKYKCRHRKPRDPETVPSGGSDLKNEYREKMGWVVYADGIYDTKGHNLSRMYINGWVSEKSPYPSKREMETLCGPSMKLNIDLHAAADFSSASDSVSASTSEAKSAADIAALEDSLKAFCELSQEYKKKLHMTR